MNRRLHPLALIASVFAICVAATPLCAQEWSDEQKEVWSTVAAQWEASKSQDPSWPETYVHPAFLGWPDTSPMPRDKTSVKRWDKYDNQNSTTLEQELNPVGIVVHGDVAVAHYYYSTATENRKGERETTHGRWTDTLVKENGEWRFIAWRGGRDPRWKE